MKTCRQHRNFGWCPGLSLAAILILTFGESGGGMQAQNKLVHTCKQCGSTEASCCAMKKGSAPTPGIDENKPHNH